MRNTRRGIRITSYINDRITCRHLPLSVPKRAAMSLSFSRKEACVLVLAACHVAAALLASCSVTKHLPEGEMLYTGIKSVEFGGKGKTAADNDSAGVIKALAETAQDIDRLFTQIGSPDAARNAADTVYGEMTKEMREAEKAREQSSEKALALVKEEVNGVLAYPPNSALFGSSSRRQPLAFGLWFYSGFVNSRSAMGKWMFRHFAKQPVLISTVNPDLRVKVATNILHNYGYFRGSADYELLPNSDSTKSKIRYYVTPREPYRFDSITYLNFPSGMDSLVRKNPERRLLKTGDVFSLANIGEEQVRLKDLFRNNGYYFYSNEYTTFRADTFAHPGYVQLQVLPAGNMPGMMKRKWYYGKKRIFIDVVPGRDEGKSFSLGDFEFHYTGRKIPLRPSVWRQNMFSLRGMPYSYREEQYTLEKLSSMGLFSQMNMSYIPRDTTGICDTLDVLVYASMDKPYESEFTMDVNSKSNDQIGPGAAFRVTKKNVFRAGESMSFQIYGSYEWQLKTPDKESNDLLDSYELGSSFELKFPRIFFPGLANKNYRYPSSTAFSLSADWMKRSDYFNMVKFGLSMAYKWERSRRVTHELTVFSLDFDRTVNKSAKFDSIMNANPALYVSMRDQFIPSIGYTFTYSSSRQSRNPVWVQATFKEAGNLLSCAYAAAGRKFSESGKALFGNPFAQFVKATAEVHKTYALGSSLKLATRLFGGVICSYGNSSAAPYSEQFNIGGANSVRAFTIRSIGPGRFKSDETKYAYMNQTGDIKLAANAELRFPLFGSLHGAVFLDAGNVWLLRKDDSRPEGQLSSAGFLKSIALGTGAGLRYDMEFLVLRLDLGIALHNPYDTGKSGYYNIRKFSDSLALHFAIGYPF